MLYSVTNLFNILNIKFFAAVNPVVEQKPRARLFHHPVIFSKFDVLPSKSLEC